MNSPSPLVPQGAIPPKTTSRPQRVLMIAAMVVGLHVAGLSLVLFQGCGKDNTGKTAANASAADTNASATAMSYPATPDTNLPGSMFTAATNPASPNMARANTNLPPAPLPGVATPGVGAANLAGVTPDTSLPGATGAVEPAATPSGPEKDYKVAKGDTLTTIASRNGITVGALMKSNPNLDPKKLKVGQTIKVPATVAGAATGSRTIAGTASIPPAGATGASGASTGGATTTYKVKAGDTLTKIAKAHGITVNQLRAANNMKTTQVQVGKVLKIPAPTQKTAAVPAATNTTQH